MMRTILAVVAALGVLACSDASGTATGPAAESPHVSKFVIVGGGGGAIFGPQACLRTTGKPNSETFAFTGADGGSAHLVITDNGVQGLNGTITLNGVDVVTHSMFGGNAPVNDTIAITTAASNTIVCTLEGKPGSGLTMTVNQ
jgi:hypothetical protein